MDHLTKQAKLQSRLRHDLVEHSRQALWMHPGCMLLVLGTTHFLRNAPALACTIVSTVLLQSFLRMWILRGMRQSTAATEVLWYRRQVALGLSCAAAWGATANLALLIGGYGNHDFLVFLLYHAVVTFSTISVLAYERRLLVLTLVLRLGPLMLGDLLFGIQEPLSYLIAAIAFFAFGMHQGLRLHRNYHQQISDNYDLSAAAYQDSLTTLPNRLFVRDVLESSIHQARAHGNSLALLYIDLDGFKQINDQYSHRIGDLVLCEAATRLRAALRSTDTPGRIGGDEFTAILPSCNSPEEALAVAHRILLSARTPVCVEGYTLHYSTSIGISLLAPTAAPAVVTFPADPRPRSGATPLQPSAARRLSASGIHSMPMPQPMPVSKTADHLVRSADEAMYAAKMAGKNRIYVSLPQGEVPASVDGCSLELLQPNQAELCLGIA